MCDRPALSYLEPDLVCHRHISTSIGGIRLSVDLGSHSITAIPAA